MHSNELLDLKAVCSFFGGSRPINAATLYRGIKGGRYPQPIKVAPNISRWLASECAEALAKMTGRAAAEFASLSYACAAPPLPLASTQIVQSAAPLTTNEPVRVGAMALPANREPAHLVGVYFLFFHSELVYVGASSNALFRIGQHVRAAEMQFTHWAFTSCSLRSLADTEEQYIRAYSPRYNALRSSGINPRIEVRVGDLRGEG
jgi:predicted DNA-binding transcriptional regulator AlpA